MTVSDGDGRAVLRRLGAHDTEIDDAERAGVLNLLAVMYAALPGERRYTPVELAGAAGIDRELARRLWRGLGFPDVDENERVFTDADVEALRMVQLLLTAQMVDLDVIVQMTRVIGSSIARIVDAMVTTAPLPVVEEVDDRTPGAIEIVTTVVDAALARQARLLEYVLRRHLQATVRRELVMRLEKGEDGAHAAPPNTMAVGFADLVGFTAMSQQLEPAELAKVVSRFEELAFEQVTAHGGRVTKMIGDEVMFVVRDVADAVDTGLALADAYAGDELLSDVRVGIAYGDVLVHEGDYFGPVPNLASRIVGIAVPGSVVVSQEIRDLVADDRRYAFHALRPRYLKDIGRVPLWRVRRSHPSFTR